MQKTILAIEDDISIRNNIYEMLEEDYTVILAVNGKEGVKLAREHKPDVIVCDIMMPELDGYGVIQIVRLDKNLEYIPFIFLTAKADKDSILQGMNLGADYYLTKPFEMQELRNAVITVLTKAERIDILIKEKTEHLTKEEKDKERSRLLKMIPDQFGNFLNAIIGSAQLLREEIPENGSDADIAINDILKTSGKFYGSLWSYFRSIEK